MSLQEGIDRGHIGSKRSSWAKLHYRDLALKVCQEHSESSVEDLAQFFLDELRNHPEFLDSIAIYVMANVKASLTPPRSKPRSDLSLEQEVIKSVAQKAKEMILMELQMPSGKTLGESTGAECLKTGGWLNAVGKKVGKTGIVGKKLKEAELKKIFLASSS